MGEKKAKKVDVEYKLGEIAATVRRLEANVSAVVRELVNLQDRLKKIEQSQDLSTKYIIISKKQLFGLIGSIMGSLGSLIYYVYLILSGGKGG